jgi:hypothetical protein
MENIVKIQKNSDKKKEMYIRIMNEILTELKISANELGNLLGKKRSQSIYDILDPNKKVGISLNMADSICDKFPQFNKCYLLTGEGDLLKNNQQIGDISNSTVVGANVSGNGVTISHNDFQVITEMVELQKGYQGMIQKSQEQIDSLIEIIKQISNK